MTEITINNTTFLVHPGKGVFMPEKETLLVSDLHVGKTTHFRKNGVSLPSDVFFEDLERLAEQLRFFKPERLLLLGDLFHSDENHEFELWEHFISKFKSLQVELIPGNHDRPESKLERFSIDKVHELILEEDGFLFSHDKVEKEGMFSVYGHVHPGVKLKGKGLQGIKLPCLFQSEKEMILPAFCQFSGMYILKPNKRDTVFVFSGDEVIRVS